MKKKNIIITVIIVFLLSVNVVFGLKLNIINKIDTKVKDIISNNQRNSIDENLKVELNKYVPFEEDENAWYSKYKVIAHSGGGINGKEFTNSKEAWENSYNNGDRVFDADIRLTSDGILILRHSWQDDFEQNMDFHYIKDDLNVVQVKESELPSYEQFKNTLIYNQFHPMSFDDVVDFMEKHPEVYVALDVKVDIEKAYKSIVENYSDDILNRIIVSFYRYDDYYKIKEIYPFKNWIIRQYNNISNNYLEMVKFCMDNNIKVVSISEELLNSDDISILYEKTTSTIIQL